QELQLMQAMHIIHEHAAEWAIDEQAVFTCGFSAGGHIAASVATRWNDPSLTSRLAFEPQGTELRPAGSILCYPMLTADMRDFYQRMRNVPGNIAWQAELILDALFSTTNPTDEQLEETNLVRYVGAQVPPIFVWHSIDDPVVDPLATTRFVLALQEQGIPCEYHLYGSGGHGLACANEQYAKCPSDVSPKVATWIPMAVTWMKECRQASYHH
ncbi:MAG: alpha/beta hydrolase, partial [Coriobacteriales bacterium]|nr:alpha/beta hydrolase [Coriobacteriales bacterium]